MKSNTKETDTPEVEKDVNTIESEVVDSKDNSTRSTFRDYYYSEDEIKERAARDELRKKRLSEQRRLLSFVMVFFLAFFVLYFLSINNPSIYDINKDTLFVINEAFNAFVLLLIPFFLGSLGAIARVLLAGISIQHSLTLIVSSGMMGMFSWVGIKSGILTSLLIPYIQTSNTQAQSVVSTVGDPTIHNFYSMALVAILVGMFSSNVYIFINQKVEKLTAENNHRSPQ